MIGNNSDRNKNKSSDSERSSGSDRSSDKESGSQGGQSGRGNSGTSSERSSSQDINSPSGNIQDMDTTGETLRDSMQEDQAVDSDDYLGIGDAIGEEDRGLLETSGDMAR
ncbi:MAG TPA: hypothetical protein VEC16_06445 [Alphaproteobacteria bacterium]|nr:hypothetical protein [Alphaproteobacteria bacterium]